MEILQTIWTALTTPNEGLIQIIGIPFTFLEIYLYMLLFTTVLNISASKKQKVTYVLSFSLITIISNSFIPKVYSGFLLMVICPILVILIFKINLLKAIIAEILPLLVSVILESVIIKFYLLAFGLTYDEIAIIPLYREIVVITVYICMFIFYLISKKLKLYINLLENMDKKTKFIIIINLIIGVFALGIQLLLISLYNETLPAIVTLLSIFTLIAYFFTSLYSLSKVTKLQLTTQSLEEAQLYNKSLKILHDNVRAFKHDFSNIVQAIGRICWN